VIEDTSGALTTGRQLQGVAAASTGSQLETWRGGGGTQPSSAYGFCQWLNFPQPNGRTDDVYLTAPPTTQPGDSGCPVVLAGTAEIVGHAIGASPPAVGYVQDASYQLESLA